MPYYPKSQIKTGLYTNGNKYRLSTSGDLYIGYYYELSNGKKYTGKDQNEKPNILLKNISTPINNNIDPNNSPPLVYTEHNFSYSVPNTSRNLYVPQFNTPLPTKDDYTRGEFTRYFCRKTNELKYLEITQETYNRLASKSGDILWSLYEPFKIPWKITQNVLFNSQINENKTQEIIRKLNLDNFNLLIVDFSLYSPLPQQDELPSPSQTPPPSPSTNGSGGSGGVSSGGGY